jgi:hypothetical protein
VGAGDQGLFHIKELIGQVQGPDVSHQRATKEDDLLHIQP